VKSDLLILRNSEKTERQTIQQSIGHIYICEVKVDFPKPPASSLFILNDMIKCLLVVEIFKNPFIASSSNFFTHEPFEEEWQGE